MKLKNIFIGLRRKKQPSPENHNYQDNVVASSNISKQVASITLTSNNKLEEALRKLIDIEGPGILCNVNLSNVLQDLNAQENNEAEFHTLCILSKKGYLREYYETGGDINLVEQIFKKSVNTSGVKEIHVVNIFDILASALDWPFVDSHLSKVCPLVSMSFMGCRLGDTIEHISKILNSQDIHYDTKLKSGIIEFIRYHGLVFNKWDASVRAYFTPLKKSVVKMEIIFDITSEKGISKDDAILYLEGHKDSIISLYKTKYKDGKFDLRLLPELTTLVIYLNQGSIKLTFNNGTNVFSNTPCLRATILYELKDWETVCQDESRIQNQIMAQKRNNRMNEIKKDIGQEYDHLIDDI